MVHKEDTELSKFYSGPQQPECSSRNGCAICVALSTTTGRVAEAESASVLGVESHTHTHIHLPHTHPFDNCKFWAKKKQSIEDCEITESNSD